MSTITKERVAGIASGEKCYTHDDVVELARIALASLETEPVCVIDQSNLDYLKSGSDADVWPASRTEMGDVLLYRAVVPAPVSVPDDIPDSVYEVLCQACGGGEKACDFADELLNACREAMLQDKE
ncbi:TPA: hypothetical protein ACOEGA_000605 [Enterobacter asburiae]|uniref:hypothetical protein n=1 Tax=Enterobacter asburiae TaxID=61645 RepID=UPI0007948E03|nr:hypothetical protein [Enterobacter asburiae]GJK01222.1 hypothetical protein TUM16655_46710 [Enterobacter cloacae]CZW93855.1 Uncharacterised protein [Enterobacter cloacae]CZY50599.1 Uncharacterised protein [Enterobacter cloacae]